MRSGSRSTLTGVHMSRSYVVVTFGLYMIHGSLPCWSLPLSEQIWSAVSFYFCVVFCFVFLRASRPWTVSPETMSQTNQLLLMEAVDVRYSFLALGKQTNVMYFIFIFLLPVFLKFHHKINVFNNVLICSLQFQNIMSYF